MNARIRDDIQSAGVHEAAHYIVAIHFNIGGAPKVFTRHFGGKIEVGGETRYEYPPTKFVNCASSWAGVLAEDLIGPRHMNRSVPPFPPETHLRDWHFWVLGGAMKELSESDQAGINALLHPWRAVKSAFRIISTNRGRIVELAGLLVGAEERTRREADERDPNNFKNSNPHLASLMDAWIAKVEAARRENPAGFSFEALHEKESIAP